MKKFAASIILVLLTITAGVLLLMPAPVAVIENESGSPVSVRLETDVGESYVVGPVSPGGSVRITISGRDKAIWAVAEFPSGRVLKSQQVYATTQGTLSVRIANEFVEVHYAL